MQRFKITDNNGNSYDDTLSDSLWTDFTVNHVTSGAGSYDSTGWYRSYDSPQLALLLNPDITKPRVFAVTIPDNSVYNKEQFQWVSTKMQPVSEVQEISELSITDMVKYCIKAVQQVYSETNWDAWAAAWLGDTDRTPASAQTVANRLQKVTFSTDMGNDGFIQAQLTQRQYDIENSNSWFSRAIAEIWYLYSTGTFDSEWILKTGLVNIIFAAAGQGELDFTEVFNS